MDGFRERLTECIGGSAHRSIADEGAAINEADALRLYEALAENPLSAKRLAKRTSSNLRRVNEWLATQVARGHLAYDAASQRCWLQQEQAGEIAKAPSRAFMNEAFAVWRSGRLLARS
ncbi:hypothetical protein AWB75_06119 [Caballeronia catudaia]|uniref:S-adenosylmethionine-dependent methyltransferase Rv2258c-like winged HTH domain-containing protein n=1 Tax=Caballeronia catudaia TaxID=1777136 RepID=A0A158D380_9BURK|nr:hypothetical protein [Caballeronia catudaia]SAK89029.1 hypothetical protein AWB75_06119 [Caballeronia catudaia]